LPSGAPIANLSGSLREEDLIFKAMVAAALFAFAAPAFGDTKEDLKDARKDAADTAKDKLGTDSGAEKTKRHVKRTGGTRSARRATPGKTSSASSTSNGYQSSSVRP